MKIFWLSVIILSLLANIMGTTQAQETTIPTIVYGDVIEGFIPAGELETEFIFNGTAGDIIVIEVYLDGTDILSGLQPDLKLLNDRGSTIAATSDIQGGLENFNLYKSLLALEVPKDGEYSILVINSSFMGASDKKAPFVLRLLKPDILEPGEVIEAETNKVEAGYYVVISEENFTVSYERSGGKFYPSINVSRINDGSLERLATAYGSEMQAATLTVDVNRNSLHLITVTSSPYDLDLFGKSEVEYTLQYGE